MKQLFFCLFIFISYISYSQTPKYIVSEDIKEKIIYGKTSITHIDKTGTYIVSEIIKYKNVSSFLPISYRSRTEILTKLDNKLKKVFTEDYEKGMKGKDFYQYYFNNDKIWLLATEYLKKEDLENLYAIEIDKNLGAIIGDWQLIKSWAKTNKTENIDVEITPNFDNTKYIISTFSNIDNSYQFEVSVHDKNLKQLGKPFNLTNDFDSKYVTISDLLFTKTNQIVLLAKVYEDVPFKRRTKRVFKENIVRVYDMKGKVLHKPKATQNNLYLYESKAIEKKGLVYMAANYGENRDGKVTGTLVQILNPETGQITTAAKQSIDSKALENIQTETNDPEEKKEIEKQEKEKSKEADNSLSSLWFNNFTLDSDGSTYTFSEEKKVYHYDVASNIDKFKYENRTQIECKNIVISKLDNVGYTSWSSIIPKFQIENYKGLLFLKDLDRLGNFQKSRFDIPRYSSYFSFETKNKIYLIFNDHKKNENVTQKNQSIKIAFGYTNTNTYVMEIDKTNGALKRSTLLNNQDLLPVVRGGKIFDGNIYMLTEDFGLFKKSHFNVIKISID